MLRTSDLDYDLPEDRIATTPASPRDAARLMVLRRSDPGFVRHCLVRDLGQFLAPGDLLVTNSTRVAPARLLGVRADTGGKVTGLYLADAPGPGVRWIVLLGGARLREGVRVELCNGAGVRHAVVLHLARRVADEPGAWEVGVEAPTLAGLGSHEVLDRAGLTPLPPYILQARKHAGLEVGDDLDRARYQTVFASGPGRSVAAPTAGLHLTPGLLDRLRGMGVSLGEVVLHVGTGTFRTVEAAHVEEHPMHAEHCHMSGATRRVIEATRASGGRVIGVGTTAARTIETFATLPEADRWVETRILITPGYRWRWVDGLLTNFHLPRSTLMAMVASLLDGGVERLKEAYALALREGYRFYSYGDAMLILP